MDGFGLRAWHVGFSGGWVRIEDLGLKRHGQGLDFGLGGFWGFWDSGFDYKGLGPALAILDGSAVGS